jgi:DNA-binding response OmpR family regulator
MNPTEAGGNLVDRCRILLVEDDDDDAELLAWSIRHQALPCRLERVNSLEDCLNACRQGTFDVILLDLNLPRVSRYEGIEIVRAQVPYSAIVVLTGLADTVTAAEAIQAGADDYVVKSIDGLRVCESIRSVWERIPGRP